MRKHIKGLLEQGCSRQEIFEKLKADAGNEMRLAKQIATFRAHPDSGFSLIVNRILLCVFFAQSVFAIWTIHTVLAPLDAEFALHGIVVVSVLSVIYFVGLLRMAFTGYAAYLMFCMVVAGNYIYGFNTVPVISIVGVLLAALSGALTYYLKVSLFPHMGFMDVRTDDEGCYILD
ncbi:hypothetical protein ACJO5Y_13540 [Marinobacter sp. GN3S48]|uniref:hypothetical protein n=1 Tax=Marinobacter sp. GN3S48 TaxID=3382302 RepID=UPI00387B97C0